MSSASRGLAPREGLESLLVKMGHTGPLTEPRHGPQPGKSGDHRSQNAGSLGLRIGVFILKTPEVDGYLQLMPLIRQPKVLRLEAGIKVD